MQRVGIVANGQLQNNHLGDYFFPAGMTAGRSPAIFLSVCDPGTVALSTVERETDVTPDLFRRPGQTGGSITRVDEPGAAGTGCCGGMTGAS